VRVHTEARLRQERIELFKRMARTLRQFCRNRNDYFLFKERAWAYRHLVFTDSATLLRSPAIKSLQKLLVDFPDWEIIICVVNQESDSEDVRQYGFEWPDSQVIIRDDAIIDSLNRDRLPREFRDLAIEGSRPDISVSDWRPTLEAIGKRDMREHSEERLEGEWNALYGRIKSILQPYGHDDIDGGDYYVIDEIFESYVHQVEMHKLHMLRPEIIKALQGVLIGHPDWEIEISVSVPEEEIIIDPGEGLTLHDDEIIDALDRALLPKEYQDLVYEGSRPPKRPDDVLLPGGS
jgi:hypothetical protein